MSSESDPVKAHNEKIRNLAKFKKQLATVLASWPLYRRFKYTDESVHLVEKGQYGSSIYSYLPQEIELQCSLCHAPQRWELTAEPYQKAKVYISKGAPFLVEYTCKNCDNASVKYLSCWKSNFDGGAEFYKIGQYPPLQDFLIIEPQLEKNLSELDLKLFRQAVICRSSNFGIAAVSYLRRVIEHAMNQLMDLIVSGNNSIDSTELPKMKRRRTDEKIAYVSQILPNELKQDGHNPLDLLYALFSDGLHNKTDEECVQIFDDALFVFEQLFRHLGQANENVKKLRAGLGSLAKRAGKSANADNPQD